MISTKRRFKQFQLDNSDDMAEYEKILNDPLCTVMEKENFKVTEKTFSDRGVLTNITERVYYLVHWEERIL